jgi:hypothetical protein
VHRFGQVKERVVFTEFNSNVGNIYIKCFQMSPQTQNFAFFHDKKALKFFSWLFSMFYCVGTNMLSEPQKVLDNSSFGIYCKGEKVFLAIFFKRFCY